MGLDMTDVDGLDMTDVDGLDMTDVDVDTHMGKILGCMGRMTIQHL
jgi:hypothetical protein